MDWTSPQSAILRIALPMHLINGDDCISGTVGDKTDID